MIARSYTNALWWEFYQRTLNDDICPVHAGGADCPTDSRRGTCWLRDVLPGVLAGRVAELDASRGQPDSACL